MTTSVPATNPAAVLFQNLLNTIGGDLIAAGGDLLDNSLAKIEASPDVQTVIAQGALIAIAAPLALPSLETNLIKASATTARALIAYGRQVAAQKLAPVS